MEPLGEVREGTCVECPGTRWGFWLGHSLCCPPFWRLSRLRRSLSSSARSWLQVITLEGWVEIMYYVMDAHSFYNFIYFILLIIVSVRGAGALWASSRTHGPGDPRVGAGVFGSPQGAPSEPGELSGREQEGQFLNAAEQQVIEGARRGWLWRPPSLLIAFISHFWTFKSTRCSCVSLCLVVSGNTFFYDHSRDAASGWKLLKGSSTSLVSWGGKMRCCETEARGCFPGRVWRGS